jgi:hypothetical protein
MLLTNYQMNKPVLITYWIPSGVVMILASKQELLILKVMIYLPVRETLFEDSVTHLLPADPVNDNNKTHRSNGGGNQAVISGVTIQSGKGKSGVNLRWHPMKEYKALSDNQREELKAWRDSNEGKASIAASKKEVFRG